MPDFDKDTPPAAPDFGAPDASFVPPPPAYGAPAPAYQLADFGKRLAALLLDGLIVFVPLFVLVTVISAFSETLGGLVYFLGIIGSFGYYFYFNMRQGSRNGQTLGKQVLKIKVVRDDNQPVDAGTVAMRDILGRLVAGFICYIGYIWALFDDTNRGWHDMIASTHVVDANENGDAL